MTEKIERILKVIPLISIIILLSSLIKNYIYYEYFGININEFISLSEFPLLFISEIKIYLIFTGLLFAVLPFIYIRNYTQKKFGEKNFTYSLTKTFTTIFILVFPVKIILILFTEKDILIIIDQCQKSLILFFVSILFVLKKEPIFLNKLYLFFCVLSLFIFSVTKAYIDIEKIKRNKPYYNIEFVFENKIYKTKKNYIFLGKTHENIFIYNLKNNYTEVYNLKEVKFFKIKKS
ncbi:hypothetical protein [Flavobacterium solisilvae]|uniref:Uncharacterized protein n=1 Tax=Flavobacterium solisilvae TaxID=1852019 RepID=A0ABX1QQW4_9FLAO|nr:hypothetical protein [Flavobacterium solisilvae]NMH24677.1 hypothetical protein [Flavobacterium solisilvae]